MPKEKKKTLFSWNKSNEASEQAKDESTNAGAAPVAPAVPGQEVDLENVAPVQTNDNNVVMSQAQLDALIGRVTASEKKVEAFMTKQTNAANDNSIRQQCTRFGATPEQAQELIDSDLTHEEKLAEVLNMSHGRITQMQSAFTTNQGAVGGHSTDELIQGEADPDYPKDASEACMKVQGEGIIENVYQIAKNKYPKAFNRKAQFAAKKAKANKN